MQQLFENWRFGQRKYFIKIVESYKIVLDLGTCIEFTECPANVDKKKKKQYYSKSTNASPTSLKHILVARPHFFIVMVSSQFNHCQKTPLAYTFEIHFFSLTVLRSFSLFL